jgi:hypothetical protein
VAGRELVEREALAVDEDDAELIDLPRLHRRGLRHVARAGDARLRRRTTAAGCENCQREVRVRGKCPGKAEAAGKPAASILRRRVVAVSPERESN